MNSIQRSFASALLAACTGLTSFAQTPLPAKAATKPLPDALKGWEGWATWDDDHRLCPTPFSDAAKHFCFWPSRLALQIDRVRGAFDLSVTVFHETWIPLPGGDEVWPAEVKADGAPVAVVQHGGLPSVQLPAGSHRLEGVYHWSEIPQRIPLPSEIGVLALTLDGKPVESPAWDAEGFLWLKRAASSEEADKDFLSIKVSAALEDGIPLWLRTEVELTVSGKSREEEIGTILPEGWKLASVESPIPVAVDETGRMKAQVRAGKWTIRADSFRLDNPTEIRFAPAAKPAAAEVLVAFRSRPDFRLVEIAGAPAIDVSQTTFPDQWRELPVYRWDPATALRIEERMRGMGLQKPAGLSFTRELWLDESGRGLTFRDRITGRMQHLWRLDAAQDLGSVRSGGQGQLITRNPQSGTAGVEIRTRNLDLEATGRMERTRELSAIGWRADADALNVTLNLPPGWRLFALFGADWVRGDWLTAWTLLDLFLLLIFSLAVSRLWGRLAGLLACVAFGLAYHEPGAPRYLWLILLIPLALLRVVPPGWGRRLLLVWKWGTIAVFALVLVPFVGRQVQQAIYPQLENTRSVGSHFLAMSVAADDRADVAAPPGDAEAVPASAAAPAPMERRVGREYSVGISSLAITKSAQKDNLAYDAKARIQTGPGVPEWRWRTATFGFNGPVQAAQKVRPVLIPITLQRGLTVLRVALVLALAAVLLRMREIGGAAVRSAGKGAAVLLALACFGASTAHAEIPPQKMLDTLRERLLKPSDAYPNAADIPAVTLSIRESRIVIDTEIHAAIRTAVPLPGRLPTCSPLTVLVDDLPDVALRREDGFLWVTVPEGVHRVRVEGQLAAATEWEWTFLLKPRRVTIDAPGWTFSGVRPDGVPEPQIFFVLKQKTTPGAASYDRQDLQTVAVIERKLELGLVWQVHTTVTRLSPAGKAVALRVPLLPGENVLSSNAVVKEGLIDVRLGAQELTFTWESSLPVTNSLTLATRATDSWVERWSLVASPVWNVAIAGLAPIFEADAPRPFTANRTISAAGGDLIPIWQPWPGEQVELSLSRPEAVAGATVTVSKGLHEIALGQRQRTARLDLSLRCSLGEDFLVDLPADAEVTSLTHAGKAIPVRKDGSRVVIPLRPGEQSISVGWKTNTALGFLARAGRVQLPVESANLTTVIQVPESRWVLWADGPLRGPAVRFWGVLVCALLAAWGLGRVPLSPLRRLEWMLLVIGLTQAPLPAALAVIAWLFALAWRGRETFQAQTTAAYNAVQVLLIALTAVALGTFVTVVAEGLLGSPEMFVSGNGSTHSSLRWYQALCETVLPSPRCFSVSIWWYRFLMLAWALWLAASLIRWLRWGWQQFCRGGFFRKTVIVPAGPPPLPVSKTV